MKKDEKVSLIQKLTDSIQATLDNKLIFLEKIEKNGVIIIPVAKISYGFGGGDGFNHHAKGQGGGAGFVAKPIGYIEIKNHESRFVSITSPISYPSLIFTTGIASYFILKGLTKLFR
jgi:uncharacterized spore protein YtfJ